MPDLSSQGKQPPNKEELQRGVWELFLSRNQRVGETMAWEMSGDPKPLERKKPMRSYLAGTPDEWILNCRYKPDVTFSVQYMGPDHWTLHVEALVQDSYNPGTKIRVSAPYPVPPDASLIEEEFYIFFRRTCHQWERHETDEWIEIHGEKRWNPHRGE